MLLRLGVYCVLYTKGFFSPLTAKKEVGYCCLTEPTSSGLSDIFQIMGKHY